MKLFYRLFLLLAIFAFSFSAIFFAGTLKERNETAARISEEAPEEIYLLAESNGKIAVYKNGENEPLCILEVNVSELPERDRLMLESGISVCGRQALYSFIEDYTG